MIPLKIILCYNLQQHYPHRRHPRHLTPPLRVILPQIVPHPTSTPHLFPNFAGKLASTTKSLTQTFFYSKNTGINFDYLRNLYKFVAFNALDDEAAAKRCSVPMSLYLK